MTQLTANFTLAELCVTQQLFANVPGPSEIANLKTLAVKLLQPLRDKLGKAVRASSGFRGAKINAAVGSKPTSQHRKGEAADIEVEGMANYDLACYIRDNFEFDQLILEAYRPGVAGSGWVHVSYREGANRNKCNTMRLGSHGPVYTSGINK